jgi:hypothetical protein
MKARPMPGPCGDDWLQNRRIAWLWPAAFLTVLVGGLVVSGSFGDLLTAAGFAVAGSLCIGNAVRCRRVHCAVTGPLYLVAAGLFLGRAGGVAMPAAAIGAGAIVGTALAFVPELLGKRYFGAVRRVS